MKKIFLFIILVIGFVFGKVQAQYCYRVYLHDKANSPYSINNPQQYLSDRAIAKRDRFGITVTEEDFPVNPAYLQAIRQVDSGIHVLATSRWFNTAVVRFPNPEALEAVRNLDFVDSLLLVGYFLNTDEQSEAPEIVLPGTVYEPTTADSLQYGEGLSQIAVHNGHLLHNEGFRGENMLIAMLDAGWLGFDRNPYFANLFENGQVQGTYNLVPGESDVYWGHSHGASCASIILSNINAEGSNGYISFVGTAPNANVIFVRTEYASSEQLIEEDFWVSGAEIADSVGADIISSSLGYTTFDYPEQEIGHSSLDGRTSLASLAATKAAHKGIVVCVAAGNEGSNEWHRISRPSDAEDILCVGAVGVDSISAPFTGVGPSFDNRVKPDVASVGYYTTYVGAWNYSQTDSVTQEESNFIYSYITQGHGTSFATPCLAGLAACLWQALPQYNSLEIMQMIREGGHIYNMPDTLMGYGIPDMYRVYLEHRNVGIGENQLLQDVSVSPNPCHNQLRVHNSAGDSKTIVIYDLTGKLIFSTAIPAESDVVVNTENWKNGLYLLLAKSDKGWSEAIKIVRQ